MNNFQQQQAAKILASYVNSGEFEDIEKAHPIGFINKYGYKKQADGSWKYASKKGNKGGVKENQPTDSNIEQKNSIKTTSSVNDKKKIKVNSHDLMSLSDLHGKEFEVEKELTVNFASGPVKYYHVKDENGKMHEVREDLAELTDSKKKDKEEIYNELDDEKTSVVSALKAGVVSAKNIKNNEIVQAWGDNTSYFLVDDKYIIGGSGDVKSYIGKNLRMKLADDGNRTTRFGSAYMRVGGGQMAYNPHILEERKVTAFANNIDDFVSQLPKGKNFGLYAMK